MANNPLNKVLFVDDRGKRINWAIDKYGEGYILMIAPCVPEALRQLSQWNWVRGDIISLDHDLNGHDFQDPDEKTSGMEILRYIDKFDALSVFKDVEFIIHSGNKFAAIKMVVFLEVFGIRVRYEPIVYSEAS